MIAPTRTNTRMQMQRLMSALLAASLVFGSVPMTAWAEDVTSQVEELSGQAAQAYGEGNFEKAIELFKQAYALQPVPNLLFNIAKVYEKTEDWVQAEKYYRDFIKSPDADSKAREAALERIDALNEIQAAEAKPDDPPVQPDKPPVIEDKPQPPPEEPSVLPWIVMGSGAVLAGGGLVFGLLASGKQTKFDDSTETEEKRELRKSGKTLAVVADSMYVAGAVAGIVGVVLLVTSGGESNPKQQTVLPTGWVGPNGQAGVGIGLRF